MFKVGDKIKRTLDGAIFTFRGVIKDKMHFVKNVKNYNVPAKMIIKPENLMEELAKGKFEKVGN